MFREELKFFKQENTVPKLEKNQRILLLLQCAVGSIGGERLWEFQCPSPSPISIKFSLTKQGRWNWGYLAV